jgi:OMF family outer membrane factor
MLVNTHRLLIITTLLLYGGITDIYGQTWSLQQCIDTSKTNNKNLTIARNEVEISTQRNKETKAKLVPSISANAEYKYYTDLPYQLMPMSVFGGPEGKFKEAQFGVPHNINAQLAFSMPLYNPQVIGAVQTSAIATELSKLKMQKQEEELLFDVTNLYYNAQLLTHSLIFVDSNIQNSQRLKQQLEILYAQQMVRKTDVEKIELQISQLNLEKERIQSQYTQVISALKLSMGVSKNTEINPVHKISHSASSTDSPANTVDFRLAQTQQLLAMRELKTLKYSRLPSFSLFGSYGTTGFGYTEAPNDFLNFYPIGFAGLRMSYPLFNGGSTQRKINQKSLEVENTKLRISLIEESTDMQRDNALLQLKISEKAIKNSDAQLEHARQIYKQTMLQHAQGTASIADVLQADNVLRQAQQNNLSAIIDYLKADLTLKKINGNLN